MAEESSSPAPSKPADAQEGEKPEPCAGEGPKTQEAKESSSDATEDTAQSTQEGQQPQQRGKWSQLMGKFGQLQGTARHWAAKSAETVGHGVVTVGGLTRGGVDAAGGLLSRVTSNKKLSEEDIALEKEREKKRERKLRVQVFGFRN